MPYENPASAKPMTEQQFQEREASIAKQRAAAEQKTAQQRVEYEQAVKEARPFAAARGITVEHYWADVKALKEHQERVMAEKLNLITPKTLTIFGKDSQPVPLYSGTTAERLYDKEGKFIGVGGAKPITGADITGGNLGGLSTSESIPNEQSWITGLQIERTTRGGATAVQQFEGIDPVKTLGLAAAQGRETMEQSTAIKQRELLLSVSPSFFGFSGQDMFGRSVSYSGLKVPFTDVNLIKPWTYYFEKPSPNTTYPIIPTEAFQREARERELGKTVIMGAEAIGATFALTRLIGVGKGVTASIAESKTLGTGAKLTAAVAGGALVLGEKAMVGGLLIQGAKSTITSYDLVLKKARGGEIRPGEVSESFGPLLGIAALGLASGLPKEIKIEAPFKTYRSSETVSPGGLPPGKVGRVSADILGEKKVYIEATVAEKGLLGGAKPYTGQGKGIILDIKEGSPSYQYRFFARDLSDKLGLYRVEAGGSGTEFKVSEDFKVSKTQFALPDNSLIKIESSKISGGKTLTVVEKVTPQGQSVFDWRVDMSRGIKSSKTTTILDESNLFAPIEIKGDLIELGKFKKLDILKTQEGGIKRSIGPLDEIKINIRKIVSYDSKSALEKEGAPKGKDLTAEDINSLFGKSKPSSSANTDFISFGSEGIAESTSRLRYNQPLRAEDIQPLNPNYKRIGQTSPLDKMMNDLYAKEFGPEWKIAKANIEDLALKGGPEIPFKPLKELIPDTQTNVRIRMAEEFVRGQFEKVYPRAEAGRAAYNIKKALGEGTPLERQEAFRSLRSILTEASQTTSVRPVEPLRTPNYGTTSSISTNLAFKKIFGQYSELAKEEYVKAVESGDLIEAAKIRGRVTGNLVDIGQGKYILKEPNVIIKPREITGLPDAKEGSAPRKLPNWKLEDIAGPLNRVIKALSTAPAKSEPGKLPEPKVKAIQEQKTEQIKNPLEEPKPIATEKVVQEKQTQRQQEEQIFGKQHTTRVYDKRLYDGYTADQAQDIGAVAGIASSAGRTLMEGLGQGVGQQRGQGANTKLNLLIGPSQTSRLAFDFPLIQANLPAQRNAERTKERTGQTKGITMDFMQVQATTFKEPPAPRTSLMPQRFTKQTTTTTPQLPIQEPIPFSPYIPPMKKGDYFGGFAFGRQSGGENKEKKFKSKFLGSKTKTIKIKPLYMPTYQNIFLARTAGQKITPLPQKEAKEYFRKTGGLSIPTREQAQSSSGKANLKQKLKGLIGI